MTHDDAFRKVQALLAKAESTAFEAEAEALISKARDLMEQHSIDEMAARQRGEKKERPVSIHWEFSSSDSNAQGKIQVLHTACKAAGVKLILSNNRRGANQGRKREDGTPAGVASQWCWMVGFESDVAMARIMYASLLLQAQRFAMQTWKDMDYKKGKSAWFTSFFMGFAGRVTQRLSELKPKQEGSSTALVHMRDREVDDFVAEQFPQLRTKKTHAGQDWGGRAAGHIAGGRADLGGQRIGSGVRKGLAS